MSEENDSIQVPEQLLNAYKQGMNDLQNLEKQAVDISYGFYEVKKKEEALHAANENVSSNREKLTNSLRLLERQMEDTCKLDRNKNWSLDLSTGAFKEVNEQNSNLNLG